MDSAIKTGSEASMDATTNLMTDGRQYGMEGMVFYWISVFLVAWLLIWLFMDVLGPMFFGPPMMMPPPYYMPYYRSDGAGRPSGIFPGFGNGFQHLASPDMARLTYDVLNANPGNIGSNGYRFS